MYVDSFFCEILSKKICARIVNLYSVSAENFVEFVRFQIPKSFSYVGGNIFVKKWIKPYDVAGAISFLFCSFCLSKLS